MEDGSYHFIKAQSIQQQYNQHFQAKPKNKSMYCSNFLLKILAITLFLCVIPLFPSDPPEFISKTIFAKSWELIHLLVIGIALSYGLFCRRKISEQNGPKSCSFQEYTGNVAQHSASFGYEGENISRDFGENGVESKSFEYSRYRSEPYVVVKRGCGGDVVERSLGLPVRSLRSRVVETDSESESESESEGEGEGEFDGRGESLCGDSSGFSEGDKGESLEGGVGGKGVLNGWDSRSMRGGFEEESDGFGMYGEKGVNFEGVMGRGGFGNGWESRSMRTDFVVGDENFGLRNGKVENFEGNVGSNGLESRSMRTDFRDGGGDFGLHCGEGRNFEGNVGSNGFENGWNSRYMMTGLVAGNGGFELASGQGVTSEGSVGNNNALNGWKSRSMRTDFMEGNGQFGLHGEKGENLEINVGDSVAPNEWKSRSMRTGFVAANGDFGLHGGKCENMPEKVGDCVAANEWKSRSMRTDFMAGNGDFGLHSGKGENFEVNVGDSVAPNEWKSRSMRTSFVTGNGDFGLHGGKGENFQGNVVDGAAPNEWKSRSMSTDFMPENGYFGLHGGKGENFDENMDIDTFQNGWNSLSMRTGCIGESGNVESASGKGENLEGNVWNPSSVSRKSQSMRSDFVVNNGTFESEPSKSQSFRSPIQGGTSYGMNAGFCSWLPQSPIIPEENFWSGVNANTPFSNIHTQVNNANFVGSSSTFDNRTRMYNFENGNWATPPVVENSKSLSENSTIFMPSEKDVAQPILSSPQEKNEEHFMPRTPEVPSSVAVPSGDFASPIRASKRSKPKLRFSSKKNEQILEKDNSVRNFAQGGNSCPFPAISPVTVPTPVDDIASPIKGSFLKKNEEGDNDTTLILKNAPKSDLTSSVTERRSTDVNHGPLLKKDDGECSESVNEMPKDGVKAPSAKGSLRSKNKKKSTPVKWDEDSFLIPLSENNDTEDLEQVVVQDDHDPEQTNFSVASSTDPSSNIMSFDEQGLQHKKTPADFLETEYVVNEDVPLNRTADYSEMQNLSKENEAYKPSTPLPPGLPLQVEIRENDIDIDVRASVESSSTALSDGSLLNEQHGMDQGSPPISKREKSLSKASYYKPSTPPPPGPLPRVEIRENKIDIEMPSSLESSSRALLDQQHDVDQGIPVTPKREKPLSKNTHSRGFSCTSFFDRDLRKSFKNEAKEENRKSEGDQYVGKAGKCGCLSLDVRPTLSKAALKGKSVRTIRPREVVPERNDQNVKFEQKPETGAERKEQNSEMVVIKIGISEKRPNSNGRKREKQRKVLGTSIIVGLNSKEGSNAKAAVLCDVKEDEPDSEIDKKADEFIAKFKEQIRLQKVPARAESTRRQLPQTHSLFFLFLCCIFSNPKIHLIL